MISAPDDRPGVYTFEVDGAPVATFDSTSVWMAKHAFPESIWRELVTLAVDPSPYWKERSPVRQVVREATQAEWAKWEAYVAESMPPDEPEGAMLWLVPMKRKGLDGAGP